MRKIVFLLTICFLVMASLSAQEAENDKVAIKKAALDYFEGWYTGSGERMARALSPELAKRFITAGPGKRHILRYSPYIMMVEYAASGAGKKPLDELNIQVEIFEILDNIATAKIESVDYYDYLHLGKVNGEWKIINVLWTPPQTPDVEEGESQIEAVIRDYIEGIYTGDVKRTVRGLSPELAKRFISQLPNGRDFINHTTYLFLVEAASTKSMIKDLSEVQEVKILSTNPHFS